ncbi:MAG: hypothetical protein C0413_01000 [Clostridiales bacterium]|nr:hypothetical protein [Clostridiales bacterium]
MARSVFWHACLKGSHMQKQLQKTHTNEQPILPIRENHAFSWRFIAALTLMGCLAVEVLLNLLPIDYDTPILYWFFPVSLLLASQMYFNQRITRYFEIKLLLAFFVWGCVTVVLNYGRAQLVNSYLWFASISTVIFLGFTLPYAFEKEGARRVLLLLAAVTFFAAVLLCVASLIAVFAKEVAAKAPSIFEDIFIGQGRLSIDDHPNRSAPSPALGVVLAGVLLAGVKKGWQRILIVLGAVICFVTLALTGSRTAILGAGFAVAFEAALTLRQVLRGKIHSVLRVCISLFVAVVITVGFYFASALTQQGCNTLLVRMEAVQTMPQQTQIPVEPAADSMPAVESAADVTAPSPAEDLVITRDFSDADSFNGRTDIWRGIWNGLLQNPKIFLIGTGPTMANNAMLPYFPSINPVGPFHNSFLDVLVALGIPGLFLLLVFLAMTALAAIRLSLGRASDQPLMVKLLPAVMILVLAEGMMEDNMFLSTSLNILWVWLMISAGFVLRLSKKEPELQEVKDS